MPELAKLAVWHKTVVGLVGEAGAVGGQLVVLDRGAVVHCRSTVLQCYTIEVLCYSITVLQYRSTVLLSRSPVLQYYSVTV